MDGAELRSAIARTGKSRKTLARAMGTTERTLLNKLTGRTQFKGKEIMALARELGLSLGEVDRIFFDCSVNENHGRSGKKG